MSHEKKLYNDFKQFGGVAALVLVGADKVLEGAHYHVMCLGIKCGLSVEGCASCDAGKILNDARTRIERTIRQLNEMHELELELLKAGEL